jgi:hypothetical protein
MPGVQREDGRYDVDPVRSRNRDNHLAENRLLGVLSGFDRTEDGGGEHVGRKDTKPVDNDEVLDLGSEKG